MNIIILLIGDIFIARIENRINSEKTRVLTGSAYTESVKEFHNWNEAFEWAKNRIPKECQEFITFRKVSKN